jgi:hypothetical protein
MSRDVLLDQAAQLISDARVACLKLAISPEDIAKIMMDEAVLASWQRGFRSQIFKSRSKNTPNANCLGST